MHGRISPYLFLARITAVLGMSFTLAIAILALVGGWWSLAAIGVASFLPFFLLMRYIERGRDGSEAPS